MRRSGLGFSRREMLKMMSASGVMSLFPGCVSNNVSNNKQQPNVLFIAVDDLRPDLGCYGNRFVKSPNIDKLAGKGVVFNKAYCQQAVCNPSRASLLTGLRPDTIGVLDLQTDFRETAPDVVTLPEHFKNNGYHTAAIGKIYHNTLPDEKSWSEPKLHIDGYPFDPDAVYRGEKNIALLEGRKKEIIEAGKEDNYIDELGQWYLKTEATECVDVPDNAYFDGAQTDVAIDKLSQLKKGDKPFFLGVGYYRPHLPFNAPKKYWDLYNREDIPLASNPQLTKDMPHMAINNLRELRSYSDFKDAPHPNVAPLPEAEQRLLRHGYFACVSYIDAQIGRLMDALEKEGLADNTIIVLWGDHGWKLGEHQSWCKMTNFEIDTRVPLIIYAPEAKAKGAVCDELVEFVDVYPTLAEIAGLEIPVTLEGISAGPLLDNPDLKWKTAAFSQFLRDGIWMAQDGVPYLGYCIRTQTHRYVEWLRVEDKEKVAVELYDLRIDPQELNNVAEAGENSQLVVELSERLKAGWRGALPSKN